MNFGLTDALELTGGRRLFHKPNAATSARARAYCSCGEIAPPQRHTEGEVDRAFEAAHAWITKAEDALPFERELRREVAGLKRASAAKSG